jgi:hypothetical protein
LWTKKWVLEASGRQGLQVIVPVKKIAAERLSLPGGVMIRLHVLGSIRR